MSATDLGALELPAAWQRRFNDPADEYDREARTGRCYELAGAAQINFALAGWRTPILVHGTIGPYSNPHAWLELRAGGQRLVWDGVLDRLMLWWHYRDDLHARAWSRYSSAQTAQLQVRAESYGPYGQADIARSIACVTAMRDVHGIDPEGATQRLRQLTERASA